MSQENPQDTGPGAAPEPQPYCKAASFANERLAGIVYFPIQEMIYEDDTVDLSVYRMIMYGLWSVAVLGFEPPDTKRLRLEAILEKGTLIDLPPPVRQDLEEPRSEQIKKSSWVKQHHRPRRRL